MLGIYGSGCDSTICILQKQLEQSHLTLLSQSRTHSQANHEIIDYIMLLAENIDNWKEPKVPLERNKGQCADNRLTTILITKSSIL